MSANTSIVIRSDAAAGLAVLVDVAGPVGTIVLNRPDRSNAWTPEMEELFFTALERFDADPAVRVIVVTGAGRAFCVGADSERLKSVQRGSSRVSRRSKTMPIRARKPVIAAINGACAGLGLVIALACDIRIASTEARFSTAFARRGLTAELGISWILPRLVGTATALDLLLSGRVFAGSEAAAIGVVNRAVAPDRVLDEAYAYARDLAQNSSPAAMAMIKRQVYKHLETTLAAAERESLRLADASVGAPDFAEGIASFLEKRPPRFDALPVSPSVAQRGSSRSVKHRSHKARS